MTAYNKVNGHYCAENDHLLRDILKGDWGFDGFVESDWFLGTRSTVGSGAGRPRHRDAVAGLLRQRSRRRGRARRRADGEHRRRGAADPARQALPRARHRSARTRPTRGRESGAHRRSRSRSRARRSCCSRTQPARCRSIARPLRSIAVVGRARGSVNLGDTGSSNVSPSVRRSRRSQGIRAPRRRRCRDPRSSATRRRRTSQSTIAAADAAVVVVGLTSADEGEGVVGAGDRHTLALSAEQEALIRARGGRESAHDRRPRRRQRDHGGELDRRRRGPPHGLVPGPGGRQRDRRRTLRRRQPVRQAAVHLPALRGRSARVRLRPGATGSDVRLLSRLSLPRSARHRAPLRVRIRLELHDLRVRQSRAPQHGALAAGKAPGERRRDQHRRGGGRRDRAALRRRGRIARRSARQGPACVRARAASLPARRARSS